MGTLDAQSVGVGFGIHQPEVIELYSARALGMANDLSGPWRADQRRGVQDLLAGVLGLGGQIMPVPAVVMRTDREPGAGVKFDPVSWQIHVRESALGNPLEVLGGLLREARVAEQAFTEARILAGLEAPNGAGLTSDRAHVIGQAKSAPLTFGMPGFTAGSMWLSQSLQPPEGPSSSQHMVAVAEAEARLMQARAAYLAPATLNADERRRRADTLMQARMRYIEIVGAYMRDWPGAADAFAVQDRFRVLVWHEQVRVSRPYTPGYKLTWYATGVELFALAPGPESNASAQVAPLRLGNDNRRHWRPAWHPRRVRIAVGPHQHLDLGTGWPSIDTLHVFLGAMPPSTSYGPIIDVGVGRSYTVAEAKAIANEVFRTTPGVLAVPAGSLTWSETDWPDWSVDVWPINARGDDVTFAEFAVPEYFVVPSVLAGSAFVRTPHGLPRVSPSAATVAPGSNPPHSTFQLKKGWVAEQTRDHGVWVYRPDVRRQAGADAPRVGGGARATRAPWLTVGVPGRADVPVEADVWAQVQLFLDGAGKGIPLDLMLHGTVEGVGPNVAGWVSAQPPAPGPIGSQQSAPAATSMAPVPITPQTFATSMSPAAQQMLAGFGAGAAVRESYRVGRYEVQRVRGALFEQDADAYVVALGVTVSRQRAQVELGWALRSGRQAWIRRVTRLNLPAATSPERRWAGLLAAFVREALVEADRLGARTVAFPTDVDKHAHGPFQVMRTADRGFEDLALTRVQRVVFADQPHRSPAPGSEPTSPIGRLRWERILINVYDFVTRDWPGYRSLMHAAPAAAMLTQVERLEAQLSELLLAVGIHTHVPDRTATDELWEQLKTLEKGIVDWFTQNNPGAAAFNLSDDQLNLVALLRGQLTTMHDALTTSIGQRQLPRRGRELLSAVQTVRTTLNGLEQDSRLHRQELEQAVIATEHLAVDVGEHGWAVKGISLPRVSRDGDALLTSLIRVAPSHFARYGIDEAGKVQGLRTELAGRLQTRIRTKVPIDVDLDPLQPVLMQHRLWLDQVSKPGRYFSVVERAVIQILIEDLQIPIRKVTDAGQPVTPDDQIPVVYVGWLWLAGSYTDPSSRDRDEPPPDLGDGPASGSGTAHKRPPGDGSDPPPPKRSQPSTTEAAAHTGTPPRAQSWELGHGAAVQELVNGWHTFMARWETDVHPRLGLLWFQVAFQGTAGPQVRQAVDAVRGAVGRVEAR